MTVVHAVALMSGRTPYSGSANWGVHRVPVRKSQTGTSRKNCSAGDRSETRIPTVIATDSPAQARRIHRTTVSNRRGRDCVRGTWPWDGGGVVAAPAAGVLRA